MVSEIFDLYDRRVLLNQQLQNKVHAFGEKYGMSCNQVVALIVERYFRLPEVQRERLEEDIYYANNAKKAGRVVEVVVNIKLKKKRTKKPKQTKTERV